ncbi:methyltransferase-like protein 27 [Strongylocentrotus purpuratus]|nr:methyltransferase-like protein 27 [Strongylocentrotus purpuratus]|eukprot:XP_003730498.1 PREDICTED: Williams-Beuren syndrome chromosomal region 27 protein-like [Strongylocentrotus purpuratus]
MSMATGEDDLHWKNLYSATSGDLDLKRLEEAYKGWSETYDEDQVKMKFNGPHQAAQKLSSLMADKSKKILDVACGTGGVGKELHSQGYVNIDGVDLVQDMLTHAEQTGVYSRLEACDVIGQGISCPDGTYDAIVCVGAFNQGNITQAVFPELLRVAKKGCIILIVMREAFVYTCPDFKNGQLDTDILMRAQNGIWKYTLRETVPKFIGDLSGLLYAMEVQ